ncbi:uncharacterized protein LOC130656269 [Hydractinia symbiolongicarpus]|uniref:uncharacterized protein LOC130656269 n=1 Tax=Hydractinia symbiolongicarpus TaxID=13093 RepID=UPI00254E3BEB|nr:uncharacterized protein LOC130656269 [Hydractinia symbiolongicarpus]
MLFNYIVFAGCLTVICHGQDNLDEANFLLRQELQIQNRACEGVAKMEKLVSKVTEFSENETIALKVKLSYLKISICEVSKKTDILIDAVESLKKSQISSKCFKQHQCNEIIPAIDSLENDLKKRKEEHDLTTLRLSMIEKALSECFQDKLFRKLKVFLKKSNIICTKRIIAYIPAFEKEVKKYFLPFLLIITIVMLFLLFSSLHIAIFSTASMIVFLGYLFFFSCSFEHRELITTFQNDVLPFYLYETQTFEVLDNIFCDVRTISQFEGFKVILRDNFQHGRKNAETTNEELNKLMKLFYVQSVADNLIDRGHDELSIQARNLHKNFRRYLEELIKTLKFSQDFYNYAVNSFKAILESQSEIESWQILIFLKNILTKSDHLQEDFSTHEVHFQELIKELNHLVPQIRKRQQSNDNINLRVTMFATLLTVGASILYPPLLLALVPIGGGVMYYVHKQAKENNAVLQDLNKYRVQMKDYARKTIHQISKIDPMKITFARSLFSITSIISLSRN